MYGNEMRCGCMGMRGVDVWNDMRCGCMGMRGGCGCMET